VGTHILLWFRDNWFPFLQTVGIIGGLVFTAVSIRQATKARKVSDLLALTEQHRQLWNGVYTRPGLERIYAERADLLANPITVPEERFLNEVIVHFQTGWHPLRDLHPNVNAFEPTPIAIYLTHGKNHFQRTAKNPHQATYPPPQAHCA
jgi:hypothetical protein